MVKKTNKSFSEWISKFEKEDSPIGDLACDIKDDSKFKDITSYFETYNHLSRLGACSDALSTFNEAYEKYRTNIDKATRGFINGKFNIDKYKMDLFLDLKYEFLYELEELDDEDDKKRKNVLEDLLTKRIENLIKTKKRKS